MVIAFIPFGFLLPVIHNKIKNSFHIIIATLSFSVLVEVLQHITSRGVADIDDVISSVLGSLIGYSLLKIMLKVILILKKSFSNQKIIEN